jgi:plasmid stabilization system protein ParE
VEEARAAYRWYARRSATIANQVMAELDAAINQIMAAPAQWPPHLQGTRAFRLHHFPYLIVYRDTGLGLQVVAVAHTSRRPGYWRRRTP